MIMTNLKVWDKIYYKYNILWGNYNYSFNEIDRITKTLIITKSWTKLENRGHFWLLKNKSRFCWDDYYYLLTEDIIEDNKRIAEEYKINKWFDDKKFILEEKIKIYNLFNI